MPTPRWHDEDTDALCRYVRGGNAPFSAIASAFGITRNAVAGKIWRLRRRGVLPPGITLPPRDPKPRIRKPRPYVPRKPADGGSARPARTVRRSWRSLSAGSAAALLVCCECPADILSVRGCRYVITPDHHAAGRTLADLRCCNNPRVPGLSWCLGHCRMVYR